MSKEYMEVIKEPTQTESKQINCINYVHKIHRHHDQA